LRFLGVELVLVVVLESATTCIEDLPCGEVFLGSVFDFCCA
jgi:hypothetical protein